MLLLRFMKFLDRNKNKIDINLFITLFVIRFFLYWPRSSQTDDLGKYKKVLSELSNMLPYVKIQNYIKVPARFARAGQNGFLPGGKCFLFVPWEKILVIQSRPFVTGTRTIMQFYHLFPLNSNYGFIFCSQ